MNAMEREQVGWDGSMPKTTENQSCPYYMDLLAIANRNVIVSIV
jgi:hypothetical protein